MVEIWHLKAEAAYLCARYTAINNPIMAFCNIDTPTTFIDIAVPCNNKASNSIRLMWWMLAREVLCLRGSISRDLPWEVMPNLFYRDPEEVE